MNLQKRLAGRMMNCSPRRMKLSTISSDEVKGAITRGMIRGLVKKGIIIKEPIKGHSRGHARFLKRQKLKGRRRGLGSRRGTKNARTPHKDEWMRRIRAQRELISSLKKRNMLSQENYLDIYAKSKGGFFRSKRHIYIYAKERGLIK